MCCRATPALLVPFLAKPDSSITPTVPIGVPAAEGTNSSAKADWISAWTSSDCQGATAMNFWSPETCPVPVHSAIGSMLLRSGQHISPLR